MPSSNSIEVEVDVEAAKRAAETWENDVGRAGKRAVRALTVLAESHMKAEAPEGTGRNNPSLRDSIDTKPESLSKAARVQPFKRTREGWLLVRAIVGNPSTPTYTDERPPPGPLLEWARQKLGDAQAGWAIRESIYQSGHDTFPNRFVDRSMDDWETEVEEIAGEAVREALG